MRLMTKVFRMRVRKRWCQVAAILFTGISAALANPVTVTMQLTGPPPGPNLVGIYTDPYTALIGPAGQNSTTYPQQAINGVSTPVLCDDFTTDVSVAGTGAWQATLTNMSAFTGTALVTTVKFDTASGTDPMTQMRDYMAVAYLARQIMSLNPNSLQAEEMSYSLWGVFDPTSIDPNGPLSNAFLQGQQLTDAINYYNQAYASVDGLLNAGYNGSYFSNVDIYSPNPSNASQEYIVVKPVPEPGAYAWFAAGLAGLFWFRRRASKASAAVV